MIIGLVAVFKSHNTKVATGGSYFYANLYTLHSWIGLAAVIVYGLQWLLGVLIFALPNASAKIRMSFMPFHTFVGLTCFVFACCAALSGITERNAFSGCGYSPNGKDYNPAENYHLLQDGCKQANALGMLVLALLLCVLYSMQKLSNTYGNKNSSTPILLSDEKLDEQNSLLGKA